MHPKIGGEEMSQATDRQGRLSTSLGLTIALIMIIAAVLWFWGVPWGRGERPLEDTAVRPRIITPQGNLAEEEQTAIEVFRTASPSVVHITTLAVGAGQFSFNIFEIPQGTGSGFIWDKEGHVVTNYHVVQDAQRARVTLADGSSWNARLVGQDPDHDLAVLKIDADEADLTPIAVGQSSNLLVGQNVFAIGNPFGLDRTLTTGVISGLGREILAVTKRPIEGVIQTDAAINPGNSGGPLLDSSARLIGVNTAIYSPSGAYAGIGFAVPVDTVNTVVPQIIQNGGVDRPGLGAYIFNDVIAERLGLEGVLIRDVVPGSPADEAGLQPTRFDEEGNLDLGDVIVAVEGKTVRKTSDLFEALQPFKPGETIRLTVERNGERVNLEVTLEALPTMAPANP